MAKKESIFDKIGNALSNKDEKEAEARAKAAELAAKQRAELAALKAKASETAEAAAEKVEAVAADVEAKAKEVAEANKKRVEEAEKYKAEAEARKAELEAKRLAAEEAVKNAVIATHTVGGDETLSDIALRYYKNATRPYYTLIYEFNKDVIGENMNIIRGGQVLRIPALPEELKK